MTTLPADCMAAHLHQMADRVAAAQTIEALLDAIGPYAEVTMRRDGKATRYLVVKLSLNLNDRGKPVTE